MAEACCLTTNLVRHPSVTLTSDALYRLRDVSRQSVIGTRLQQQPNNCQLVEQSTPTHCISLLHATKEQVVLFQANVSVWSLSYFSYLTIRHDSKVFNVQSKNWWIASLVYHTQSETKKKQEIRSVELRVCPMQLFHFRSRDVHPVQNLLLCTKFHRNLMIFRWYGDITIFKMAAVRQLGIVLPPYETTHKVSVARRSGLSNFMSIWYTDLKI